MIFFFLFLPAAFCHSLLPPLFAFFNFTTPVSTCWSSLCQLHCHPRVSCISKFPKEGPASCLVTMQNRASHWVEMKTDGCLWALPYPWPAWQVTGRCGQSMTACAKEPFDPMFQKGTWVLNTWSEYCGCKTDSQPLQCGASLCAQCGCSMWSIFIVEHLLNHSTFSNTLILLWAIYMF